MWWDRIEQNKEGGGGKGVRVQGGGGTIGDEEKMLENKEEEGREKWEKEKKGKEKEKEKE